MTKNHSLIKANGFAGQHANDSTSFYIFDEASGIADKISTLPKAG